MDNWKQEEIAELKKLYVEHDVPSDSLIKDKASLEMFTDSLNERIRRMVGFEPEDVAGMLLKLRKGGKLPRIRD